MTTFVKVIEPFYRRFYDVVMFICKVFLTLDILITSMAVAGRFIPFIPDPAWSEEVVLTLMAYIAVLSAALAIQKGTHIRMTAFDPFLPRGVKLALDIVADILVLGLAVVMIKEGWNFAYIIGGRGFYTSLPWLSLFWLYFPIPLAGVAMVFFEIESIAKHLASIGKKGKVEEKVDDVTQEGEEETHGSK